MTASPIEQTVRAALQDLVRRVADRVPTALIHTYSQDHPDGRYCYASFLATTEAENLALGVLVQGQDHSFIVRADLCEGGTGQIFSEFAPAELAEDGEPERLSTTTRLVAYIRDQEENIVQYLTEAAG